MRLPDVSNKPLACLNTGIGELCIFTLRYKDTRELLNRLNAPIDQIDSEVFFKIYLPLFSYLKSDLLAPDFERPDEYLLQNDNIEKLTLEELEEIAKIFIEHNSYLYKENKTIQEKKEDGGTVLKIAKSDHIIHPKNKDETAIDYFHRLFVEREKKAKEDFLKMSSSFSMGLANDIFKTYDAGKALTDQISSISKLSDYAKSIISSSFEEKKAVATNFKVLKPQHDFAEDFAKNIRLQEETRLAPFKDLSSKMEAMIDAEKKTVEFMSDVYSTQVEIANELKSSSDSAGAYAKKNVFFTRVIIFLTFISIFIAAYPIWFDKKDKEALQTNKDLNTTMAQTNVKLEELIRVMSTQNDTKEQQITELKKELMFEKEKTSQLLKKIGVKEDEK